VEHLVVEVPGAGAGAAMLAGAEIVVAAMV